MANSVTADILTWVSDRADTRVHTVLLDPGEELGLLDAHRRLDAPLDRVKDGRAQTRASQPAQRGGAHGDQAEGDEWIQGQFAEEVYVDVDEDQSGDAAANQHGDYAAGQLVAPSGLAQCEEGVPVEGGRGRGGRCRAGRGRGTTAGDELALDRRLSSYGLPCCCGADGSRGLGGELTLGEGCDGSALGQSGLKLQASSAQSAEARKLRRRSQHRVNRVVRQCWAFARDAAQ